MVGETSDSNYPLMHHVYTVFSFEDATDQSFLRKLFVRGTCVVLNMLLYYKQSFSLLACLQGLVSWDPIITVGLVQITPNL